MTPPTIDHLGSYWRQAGEMLGFVVEAPYIVALPGEQPFTVSARLPQFGARQGMLLSTTYDYFSVRLSVLDKAGFGFSVIDAEGGDVVIADEVIEILQDWGWSDLGSHAPKWFSKT